MAAAPLRWPPVGDAAVLRLLMYPDLQWTTFRGEVLGWLRVDSDGRGIGTRQRVASYFRLLYVISPQGLVKSRWGRVVSQALTDDL